MVLAPAPISAGISLCLGVGAARVSLRQGDSCGWDGSRHWPFPQSGLGVGKTGGDKDHESPSKKTWLWHGEDTGAVGFWRLLPSLQLWHCVAT